MEQTLTLQQLIERLMNLEREVNSLHHDLAHFQQHPDASTVTLAYRWADKNIQRRWMSQVFASYSIQGKPRGALALQQEMSRANLAANELSRSLIEAREE